MEQPQTLVAQPMRYLDKAMGALRDLGLPLPPPAVEATPITGLLSQLGDLDPDRVTLIARVLNQATVFNEVVREQIRAMQIAERYEVITNSFNSIRDDAKEMVNQLSDGRISTGEKLRNMWMNVRRGDISSRFQKIRDTYLEVSKDTKTNIDRERAILEAYRDFRGAMKQAEVLTLELLKTAEGKLAAAKAAVEQAGAAVDAAGSIEPAQRAQLEMARDEALRVLQNEDGRYQICKDLADNMVGLLQHLRGHHGPAGADDLREGTRLPAIRQLLLDQRGGADRPLGLLRRAARAAREHADAERHEEGRRPVAGGAGRYRRQGAGGSAARRLWPDRLRRRRAEAGRQRGQLPGPLARDHRRDARVGDPELRGDPPLGRGSASSA